TREVAVALMQLGESAERRGDAAAARGLVEESLPIARARGGSALALGLLMLGRIERTAGNSGRARWLTEEGLGEARSVGFVGLVVDALIQLGDIARSDGDRPEAWRRYRETVSAAVGSPREGGLDEALLRCGALHQEEGAFDNAARLFGAVSAWRER